MEDLLLNAMYTAWWMNYLWLVFLVLLSLTGNLIKIIDIVLPNHIWDRVIERAKRKVRCTAQFQIKLQNMRKKFYDKGWFIDVLSTFKNTMLLIIWFQVYQYLPLLASNVLQ